MRVLHYYNWGYFEPISCGADVVASNQLEYFHRRGWDVDIVLHAQPWRTHHADAFQARYPWIRSVQVVDMPSGDFTFRGQLFAHRRLARSELYRKLAQQGHDLFLTNYVFSAPLLEALPSGCLKILEAVDIMTHSFALNERIHNPERDPMSRARDRFTWNTELELYRLFDSVLFLNEDESRLVAPRLPGRTHTVPSMMPWESRPDRETETTPAVDETFDLIFVGSEAHANLRAITSFYREIFVPYLRKLQIKMAVVGKVCDRLDFSDWYVTKLGVIPGDLREYYERSKIVIVPILEGSGLSIKTIECLANGRAVATTPVGARGLRHDPEAFLQLDMARDPRGTAEAILDLLASEPKRLRMQRAARDYYRTHFGADRYFRAMDEVMSSIGIPA